MASVGDQLRQHPLACLFFQHKNQMEKIKHFFYKAKVAWYVLVSHKMFVVTRRGENIVGAMHFTVDDRVVDEALDRACHAMTARCLKEEIEENTKSMMAEVDQILKSGK